MFLFEDLYLYASGSSLKSIGAEVSTGDDSIKWRRAAPLNGSAIYIPCSSQLRLSHPTAMVGLNDIGDSFGVILLSTIINAVFYGITVLQSLYYFDKFSEDSWSLKLVVLLVWVLDTITLVLDSHVCYHYLIVNYENPIALQFQVWSAELETAITFTVVFVVQLFFVIRIWKVGNGQWLLPICIALAAGGAFEITVAVFRFKLWTDTLGPVVTTPVQVNSILETVTDISITVVLCWLLCREKRVGRRNFRTSNIIINRWIIFLVNRGAVAALVQIFILIAKLRWPQTLIWVAFHNTVSRVYSNSMLATLNSRVVLRGIATSFENPSSSVVRTPGVGDRSIAVSNGRVTTLQFAPPRIDSMEPNMQTIDLADLASTLEQYPRPMGMLDMDNASKVDVRIWLGNTCDNAPMV
ncbi:hypothetical protein A0H81_11086 [Grifola frondosa]|uniref:DUF6534 domain-containing protein n=1 Tax=Grifola frondosa TaxID=5627 RepID=A0A1C7LWF4_GRIFR|nr:hypothetical protein A0H81_11086 [Grifola frondosa]